MPPSKPMDLGWRQLERFNEPEDEFKVTVFWGTQEGTVFIGPIRVWITSTQSQARQNPSWSRGTKGGINEFPPLDEKLVAPLLLSEGE